MKILARKADYETGQRIVCLLDVLIGLTDEDGGVGSAANTTGAVDTATGSNKTKAADFATKKARLEACKTKGTNNVDSINRFYRRDAAVVAVGSSLTTWNESAQASQTVSVTQTMLDIKAECNIRHDRYATQSDDTTVRNGTVGELDADLQLQNATQRQGDCSIDTEQWELVIKCGQAPPVKRYPATFCVVEAGSSEGTPAQIIPVWSGAFTAWDDTASHPDGGISSSSTVSDASSTNFKLTYVSYAGTNVSVGSGLRSIDRTPPSTHYWVDNHSTVVDDFNVPCSADFFLDTQWGYVNDGSCQAVSGNDTCAGNTFEPTLSLADGSSLGGVPLHVKVFPRKQIMRKEGTASVVITYTSEAVSLYENKYFWAPEAYLQEAALDANPVWAPEWSSTASDGYGLSLESGSKASGQTSAFTDAMVIEASQNISAKYEQTFKIWAQSSTASSPQNPSTTNAQTWSDDTTIVKRTAAYPDQFSYYWCTKCRGSAEGSTRYILEKRGSSFRWSQEKTSGTQGLLHSNFAGNCEASTLPASLWSSSTQPTGQEVDSANTNLTTMKKYMPAYHPHACVTHQCTNATEEGVDACSWV